MAVTIGVDVGTQGTKAGVYTTDGVQVGRAYIPHTINYRGPGLAEMDPEHLVDAAFTAIATALDEAVAAGISRSDVAGIALSGILVGQVLLDAEGTILHSLITSLDTRAQGHAIRATEELEPLWLTESGTSTLDAYAAPFQLQWIRDNQPDIWARVARSVSVAPYVAARLAGLRQEEMFTDPTHASGWMVGWDENTRTFSPGQFAAFGLPMDILPRIVPSDAVVGTVTRGASQSTGLPAGTPVIAGAGDVMQSNLASGMVEVGQSTDSAGTTSILTVGVDGIVPEVTAMPGMLYSLGTIPGQSFYWGYIRAGGLSLRWFRDQIARLDGDDSVYREFDELAAGVAPGSDGVLFLPYLAGGNPDSPDASGSWLGMDSGTDTARLWRSALEAVAYEYAATLGVAQRAGVELREVLVTGGGAASGVWNQIKADVTGIPWRRPHRVDGPVLANAALVNQGLGTSPGLAAQLAEWNAGGVSHQPDPAIHGIYRKAAAIRRDLLARPMQEVFAAVRSLRELNDN
ncbi:FGGY family carbohydrate kinase [Corynebacterium sp. YIM 101645]|uniref:FGGY family carbohydrate kinase n=1 Tax=Corynebacterium lemuris TaxID=1859292 RepID=A0ABT2FV80_9CORY|nr:FGGY family carbohydrate kinase [Corynebacterium lemuris]MCS5479066.1 FGGY family carbohydrate kinase [Corynebacterium lemuris]